MEILVERTANVAVLRCHGSLDAESVGVFRKTTQTLCQQGVDRFVVDGGALTFIDSMGLGALISLLRRVRGSDGEVKVSALTPDVRSIFEITRLNRLFDICATAAQACQKFKKGPADPSSAR
ncbi:MAG: STAS domain-containing protein [Deltaproteobacteria bacterium]|nr:STAS domain-containing protein [Deltaproteobacteria bacterium]